MIYLASQAAGNCRLPNIALFSSSSSSGAPPASTNRTLG